MIYLFRHGQTDWNLKKLCNGNTNIPLNQTGIAQGERQAENLHGIRFDACFCSPQVRARQYCEILFKGAAVYDDRLKEIYSGEFEGMEETAEMMSAFIKAVRTGEKGTERMDAFIKRNCDFCEEIVGKYAGKNVLVVTHAANSRVINYYFTGKPKDYDFIKKVVDEGGFVTYEN